MGCISCQNMGFQLIAGFYSPFLVFHYVFKFGLDELFIVNTRSSPASSGVRCQCRKADEPNSNDRVSLVSPRQNWQRPRKRCNTVQTKSISPHEMLFEILWLEEILHHQKDGWNPNKIMGWLPLINWCRISQPSTVSYLHISPVA